MPLAIFVYERKPFVDDAGEPVDEFVNIASPTDLEQYPVDLPQPESPFFRLVKVDLIFRNRELASDTVDKIVNDVQELVQSLNFADEFDEPIEILIN